MGEQLGILVGLPKPGVVGVSEFCLNLGPLSSYWIASTSIAMRVCTSIIESVRTCSMAYPWEACSFLKGNGIEVDLAGEKGKGGGMTWMSEKGGICGWHVMYKKRIKIFLKTK